MFSYTRFEIVKLKNMIKGKGINLNVSTAKSHPLIAIFTLEGDLSFLIFGADEIFYCY